MSKKTALLLFCLLLIYFSLWAQNSRAEIELDDIEVVGKAQVFVDTLKKVEENTNYTYLKEDHDLKYIPRVQKILFDKYPEQNSSHNMLLHFLGGSNGRYDGKMLYNSGQNKYLNFSFDSYSEQYADEQEYLDYTISWLFDPAGNNGGIDYQRFATTYEYEVGEKEVWFNSLRGKLPRLTFDLKDLGELDLDAKMEYIQYDHQDTYMDNEGTEVAGELSISWITNKFEGNLFIRKQEGQTQAGMELGSSALFDKAALWLAMDDEKAYASVKYSKSMAIGNNFAFIIKNTPSITSRNFRDILSENYNMDTSANYLQTKYLINQFISLHYEGSFFAGVNYNLRYLDDKMTIDDQYYQFDSIVFHLPLYQDLWEHEFSAEVMYQWNKFELKHKAIYTNYSEAVIFIPDLELTTDIKYEHNQALNAVLSAYYNTGRKIVRTDNDHKHADALLVDICFNWKIMSKMKLMLKLENITDNEYQKYDFYPAKRFSILGGIELKF